MKTQKSEWHQFSGELAGVLNNRGRNMCFVMYICYTYSLKYIKYFRIKEKGKEKKKKKGYQYIISLSWSEHHRPHFTTRNNRAQAAIMSDCLCFRYKSMCRTGRKLSWQSVCLACRKPWAPPPALHKPGLTHTHVQGHFWLHSEFEANLKYMEPTLKQQRNKDKTRKTICKKARDPPFSHWGSLDNLYR